MIRFCVIICLLHFGLAHAKTSNDNPYTIYAITKKDISELEWRIVQVNLKLGNTGYFVYFDEISNLFIVDKFVDTYTLNTTTPTMLRDLLLSTCTLVESVIGSEFKAFRIRDKKDLNIKFIIGEPSSRIFANYSSKSFSFTDDYYNFKKEQDK